MTLTNEQYEKLESALFGAAVNGELDVVQEVQAEEYTDESGHKHHEQRLRKADKADVALAMKLLDERIGGPQDFC